MCRARSSKDRRGRAPHRREFRRAPRTPPEAAARTRPRRSRYGSSSASEAVVARARPHADRRPSAGRHARCSASPSSAAHIAQDAYSHARRAELADRPHARAAVNVARRHRRREPRAVARLPLESFSSPRAWRGADPARAPGGGAHPSAESTTAEPSERTSQRARPGGRADPRPRPARRHPSAQHGCGSFPTVCRLRSSRR